jgi:hydroxyacyl-ACP dehydratase HTD2-like protein with hotdog domain
MTAAEAAQQMLRTFEGQTRVQRQVLDGHQLQKLSLTLNRPQLHPGLDVTAGPPPRGTPLPPGYHLVYFSPASLESELGPDGTDRTFNAPGPFSRRMWAGGRMAWTSGRPPLRVGDEAEERTRLVGATSKRSRDGSEMVLVDVEKEFWGPAGLALVDRRAWVFRPPPREALARSDAQVAGVVPGAVGRHSTVEDVLLDGSGELGVSRLLELDNFPCQDTATC